MPTIEKLISRAQKQIPALDSERVLHAFEFAKESHANQKRASGENYICHPLAVANILLDLNPDEDAIIAALLHDVTEDCDVDCKAIEKNFGSTVAKLVDGLEKISHLRATGEDRQINSLRKMFLAMSKDLRVVLIKLSDRLHNMQTLHFVPPEKQQRIARETLQIYAPIAARLGIYAIKSPLEDLAFFYLQPEEYQDIATQMKKHEPHRTKILKSAKKILEKILRKENVTGQITGRVKHFYSIFKKLKRKGASSIDELYDIFALRIIVKNIADCYSLLGRVHQAFTPLSKRFKDYVAVPKPNGYQSLHTTVIGLSGTKKKSIPVEIQIRTEQMQQEAEFGIASHWHYKEKGKSVPDLRKADWVKSLVVPGQKNNIEFMHDLATDAFSDRIFVLTPGGDVKDLPKGATPIDFAFLVHTDLGLCTKAAKVNGKIVPLQKELKNGDVIEIVTSKHPTPHQNWISFVRTSSARNRIRRFFKAQDREKIIRDGKQILNDQLERLGAGKLDAHLQVLKNFGNKKRSLQERLEIIERIGNGSLNVATIAKKLIAKREKRQQTFRKSETQTSKEKIDEILVAGEEKIPIRFASCCHPDPSKSIVGFVTRGQHVTIHFQDCKTIAKLDPARLIECKWSSEKRTEGVTFKIMTTENRPGLLFEIVKIFARREINLERVEPKRISPIHFEITLQAHVDIPLANKLVDLLEQIPGVGKVTESFHEE